MRRQERGGREERSREESTGDWKRNGRYGNRGDQASEDGRERKGRKKKQEKENGKRYDHVGT